MHGMTFQMAHNALAAWCGCAPFANFGNIKLVIIAAFTANHIHVDWSRQALLTLASVLAIPDVRFLVWHDTHVTWFTVTATIPLTIDAMELGAGGWLVRRWAKQLTCTGVD